MNNFTPIISTSRIKKVHIKHLAILLDPQKATLAHTVCHRTLYHFQDVTNVADHYTNGHLYMTYCPKCFPEGIPQ
jgi:hypothetical protein